MRRNYSWKRIFLVILLSSLAACQQKPPVVGMKLGKPYAVDGKAYYPEYDPTYDKIGIASWYGPGFHGKYTASGEVYNQNDLTAAHPTLPMPSLVRVTNLTNGKSVIVRINDRGPFKSNRIIDLSKKAAEKIGIHSTAQVRVQYLGKETQEYLAAAKEGNPPSMTAYNADAEQVKTDAVIASTEPGQPVSSSAPIMTVSGGDLSAPKPMPKRFALVKDAMAGDTIRSGQPMTPVRGELPRLDSAVTETPIATGSKAATSGRYIIQVGSFSSEENARKLTPKLENISAMAIDKVDMGERTWWRVKLGPFASKDEADEALERTRAAGLPDARIVHQ